MDDTQEHLTLKWGTLKSWDFSGNEPAIALLREYNELGESISAALQDDTPRQKEIICELIDLCKADQIYNDWDGVYMTKDAAKEYVMNYGKPRKSPSSPEVKHD